MDNGLNISCGINSFIYSLIIGIKKHPWKGACDSLPIGFGPEFLGVWSVTAGDSSCLWDAHQLLQMTTCGDL